MAEPKHKIVLITGAAGGIGMATARRFARLDARLVLTDIRRKELTGVADALTAEGAQVLAVPGDLLDPETVTGVVAAARQAFGGLHVLVNNAGVIIDRPLEETDDQAWEYVLGLNLGAPFRLIREARDLLAQTGASGRVINVSSTSYLGNYYQANYSSAKAGLVGLTRTLAMELARHGITVNCVAPGITDTPMVRGMPLDRVAGRTPLGRVATPVDVAACIEFLSSAAASFITGQVIHLDGGLSLGMGLR